MVIISYMKPLLLFLTLVFCTGTVHGQDNSDIGDISPDQTKMRARLNGMLIGVGAANYDAFMINGTNGLRQKISTFQFRDMVDRVRRDLADGYTVSHFGSWQLDSKTVLCFWILELNPEEEVLIEVTYFGGNFEVADFVVRDKN